MAHWGYICQPVAVGTVGIGTTAPVGLLDVRSTAVSGSGIGINITAQNAATDWPFNNGGNVAISAGTGFGQGAHGNVGIGTNAPAGFFHVYGGSALYSSGAPLLLQGQDAGSGWPFWNGGHILLLPGAGASSGAPGNVGIGTTAPTSILHLRGATPIMTFQPTGTTQQSYIQFKTSAGGAGFEFGRDRFSAGTNDFYFYDDNAGADRMYISNTGNVGIGMTAPTSRLSLSSTATNDGIQLLGNGGTWLYIFENTSVSAYNNITLAGDRGLYYGSGTIGSPGGGLVLAPWASGTSGMRLDQNGNVGIETTAPGAKLEIAGTSGVDGIKFPDGTIQTTSATVHILITHEVANGTNAGASVSGWQTRPLNSKKIDTNSLVSLSSNQVTFTAGTYYCQATAPAFGANNHKLRLRNVTDSVTLIVGSSEYAYQPSIVGNTARLVGQFTIAAGKALELQHYIAYARINDGLGTSVSSGEVEVYALLECWKN